MHVLIVLGGERPSPALLESHVAQADFVIAADSGYHAFDETHYLPDLLVGDMDSIRGEPLPSDLKVIEAPEQNATDFQKSLRYLSPETQKLTILGGTGLRCDHFLTNLLIAATIPYAINVKFVDDAQEIFRICPKYPFSSQIPQGRTVSLIPFTSCLGVTTKGLKWNLTAATMDPHIQLGQSNLTCDDVLTISLVEGLLYLVVNLPSQP